MLYSVLDAKTRRISSGQCRMMQINPQMAQQVRKYLQMQGPVQASPGYGQPPQFRYTGAPGPQSGQPWGQGGQTGEPSQWLTAISKLLGS
jgi:hypothetical protein